MYKKLKRFMQSIPTKSLIFWGVILLVIVAVNPSFSQPIRGASYDRTLQVAREKWAEQDYVNALDHFEMAFEAKKDESLLPDMAELYLQIRDYSSASKTYAKILKKDKEKKWDHLRFNYAKALKMTGNYEEAIVEFQKFLAVVSSDTLRKFAENEITGAEFGKELADKEDAIELTRLSAVINTPFSDYSPAFSREGNLYISSFMAKDVIVLDSSAKDFHAKIYFSKKNEETGVWGKPEALKANINRPEIHNVNVSISPDGNKLYFNRQVLQGNEVVESQLFYSVGGDGAWKGAKEIVGIDPEYRARHPFPGELFGREVLFFSSDIPGGFGGADLYYAPQKSEGVYGDPVNLGPKINTLGDEVTPFYYNGTLYFSSNMHPGLGGYDIFYSFWNGQNWSDPLNMSKGFNSPQDDQYFRLDADGYNGLLTSNRPAGKSVRAKTCCEDIYSFTIEKIKADLVVGTFNSGRQALKGVTVMIIPKPGGDPQTIQNDKGNKFDFKLELEKSYRIIATHPNHFPDTAVINTLNLKANKSFTQRLYLKPIPIPVPEYDTILSEKAIVMENILYEYGDDKILPTAEPDLNFLLEIMNQYPDLVIELSSHTDNRGNDEFNKALSQRRAESAKQWLLKKGINQTRIKAVGNGESVPKVVDDRLANKHPEFLPGDVFSAEYINKLETEEDKELAHALNRRTEFKIIGGPKVITVKSTRLLKREATTAADKSIGAVKPRGDSIPTIHPFSTLAGKKIYKGVPILDFTTRETNFGTVTRGEKREFTYEFQNIGDTKAEIDLISACECTTTEYNAQSIPPGGKGTIKVIFDSKDKVQGETIVIDIFLKNTEPGTERPIIEKLKYKFEIK